MNVVDPDHAEVLAHQLHETDCVVADIPWSGIGKTHRKQHETKAKRILAGLAERGLYLTTSKEN